MHNGLINQTGVAYNECGSWDSEERIPQDHPGPGIHLGGGRGGLMARWGRLGCCAAHLLFYLSAFEWLKEEIFYSEGWSLWYTFGSDLKDGVSSFHMNTVTAPFTAAIQSLTFGFASLNSVVNWAG